MKTAVHISPRIAVIGTGVFLALTGTLSIYAKDGPPYGPALKTQIGDATFYSSHFQDHKTASGRIFDKNKAMAAHRTYPFGTVVRVTNLHNGRSVNVVIVDRGPYGKNRRSGVIIDVSPSAAERLGMLKRGKARVRLEVLAWGNGERLKEAPKVVAEAKNSDHGQSGVR
jgi:peptidoglycan lytic transglycosylase